MWRLPAKTIIIGAGINGLMCAYHLLKQGNTAVEVYDHGPIPNPASASFGKHRLIHPWSKKYCTQTAQKALAALSLWRDILNDIGSDGFTQTGVFALSDSNIEERASQGINVKLLSTGDIVDLMPLLEGIDCAYAYHFPQFGVLFAEKILIDLVGYLRKSAVHFCGGRSVVAIDSKKAEVRFSDGRIVAGDKIILSAGYGTDAIVKSSFKDYEGLLPGFTSHRCYVVYVEHPRTKNEITMPAWASLGIDDMWGMPPLRKIPMKLGCGDFTRPCRPKDTDDSRTIGEKIVAKYLQMFPQFGGLMVTGYGLNHWAKVESESDHFMMGSSVIVTSDNGAGFRFAPQVALSAVNSLFET